MNYGDMNVDAVGVVNYNQATGETSMNITARFDMPVDKGVMQGIATRIGELEDLKPLDFNSTTIEQAIVEWDGQKEADKFKSDFVQEGKVKKIPDGIDYSMVITGIRLKSMTNQVDRPHGLVTDLNSAVLVNMYGKPVAKYVPFRAFFGQAYSKLITGDKWFVQIDIPGGRDYFMHYAMEKKDGTLNIRSGDSELNDEVNAIKEDKRKKKKFFYKMSKDNIFDIDFNAVFGE